MVIANNKRVPKPCLTHEKNDNFVLNKSGRRHQRKIKIYAPHNAVQDCERSKTVMSLMRCSKELVVQHFQLRQANWRISQLRKLQDKWDRISDTPTRKITPYGSAARCSVHTIPIWISMPNISSLPPQELIVQVFNQALQAHVFPKSYSSAPKETPPCQQGMSRLEPFC
ncbi:hypothetical protein AB4K20DRAFT_1982624 [Rhizopus microsporus]